MKIFTILFLLFTFNLYSQQSYVANKVEEGIKLDGKLTDIRWQSANEIEIKYEVDPGENLPAKEITTAKILYDDNNIYFGFTCLDKNPNLIRAHISKRDNLFEDDFVAIFLDTYGDSQRTYEFLVNPLGIQADLIKTLNNEDPSFDAVWQSFASINDSGWTAEIAIPFASIRFPSKENQIWKLVVGRIFPRDSKYIFSNITFDRNNSCMMCQGVNLVGINNISVPSQLSFLPYVQTSQLGNYSSSSNKIENEKIKGRVGGSVKYSPSSDIVIEGVLNPDFSQVESDASLISANSTFALFYPERRPFFMEGADIFSGTRNKIFYSRTINDPIAAVKITGKKNSFTYGYLAANDRNTPFIIPGEEESSSLSSSINSTTQVARLRYDIGNESFIGGLITSKIFSGGNNNVGSLDWNYRFNESYFFGGTVNYSSTQEMDNQKLFSDAGYENRKFETTNFDATFNGEKYNGWMFGSRLSVEKRDYELGIRVRGVSPLFQTGSGFVNEIGRKEIHLNQAWKIYPKSGIINYLQFEAVEGLVYTFDNLRKDIFSWVGVEMQLKGQINFGLNATPYNMERFAGEEFKMKPRIMLNLNASPSDLYSVGMFLGGGEYIYRDVNPEIGNGFNLGGFLSFKPNDKANFSFNYSHSSLTSLVTKKLFYDGYVARVNGTYNFLPQLYLRIISEYNKFENIFNIFPLLSYQLNPFTIFYVGTSSNFDQNYTPNKFSQKERSFFLKFQYLFQK